MDEKALHNADSEDGATTRRLDKLAAYPIRLQFGKEISPIIHWSACAIMDFKDLSSGAFKVHCLHHYFSNIFPGNVSIILIALLGNDS